MGFEISEQRSDSTSPSWLQLLPGLAVSPYQKIRASLVTQTVKNPPAMPRDLVRSLESRADPWRRDNPLESILPVEGHWTRRHSRL